MKKVMFVFYDKELESFGDPRCSNLSIDNLVQDLKRAILKGFDAEKVNQFIGQAIYEVGSYDDDSGVIVGCPAKLLIDCDQIILKRQQIEADRKAKEVTDDGKEE